MDQNARKGRSIAKKACDLCRMRKSQCVFKPDNAPSCVKCRDADIACTFLKVRKARGRRSRRLEEFRREALSSDGRGTAENEAKLSSQVPRIRRLPIDEITIEDLCPEHVFLDIVADYIERIYPVLPLVHVPSFNDLLICKQYKTDPRVFRLCVALCAVTIASVPHRMPFYTCGLYEDGGEMVEKACHMVLLSRLATNSVCLDTPSFDSMLVSVILSISSHYAGRSNAGWAYASEGVHFFRSLNLYNKKGYSKLSLIDSEICKRAFWVLYIMQIQDRLSEITPHTGLNYDPLHTDWEFLMPLEADDDFLSRKETGSLSDPEQLSPSRDDQPPLITGFIAIVRTFLCVADGIAVALPGPPLAYTLSSGGLTKQVSRTPLSDDASSPSISISIPNSPKVVALLNVMDKLEATTRSLSPPMQLPPPSSILNPLDRAEEEDTSLLARQFSIMRANVHVTSIYIQVTMLDMCLSSLKSRSDPHLSASNADTFRLTPSETPATNTAASAYEAGDSPSPATPNTVAPDVQARLWEIRKTLAQDLLTVLDSCTLYALQSNGNSMVVKIREIAATLLDSDGEAEMVTEGGDQMTREYISRFIEILAKLDRVPKSLVRGKGVQVLREH